VGYHIRRVWAVPVSLATTRGIALAFFSSGYLDVSVPPLTSSRPMGSGVGTGALPPVGFPIRKSPDQSLLGGYPELIAACHVLLRLLTPRHSPYALSSLAKTISSITVQFSRYNSRLGRAHRKRCAHKKLSYLNYSLRSIGFPGFLSAIFLLFRPASSS
jgi:hypothetical protein